MASGLDPLRFDYPVSSLDDLMAVVGRLRTTLAEEPNSWENPTLGRFLEAMEAWLSTFPQAYINVGDEIPTPDWRFVADLLRPGQTSRGVSRRLLGIRPAVERGVSHMCPEP